MAGILVLGLTQQLLEKNLEIFQQWTLSVLTCPEAHVS